LFQAPNCRCRRNWGGRFGQRLSLLQRIDAQRRSLESFAADQGLIRFRQGAVSC